MTATIKLLPIIKSQDPAKLHERLSRTMLKIDRGYETPCHEHTGSRNNCGYGRMNFRCNGKHVQVLAHRVVVTLATGREIPSNLQPDHKCQNPACRNPDHLQLVTAHRNMGVLVQQRKAAAGR
jgi:hypothetical protein